MRLQLADTDPQHFIFWDWAGLIASGMILSAGVAGIVLLVVQIRRAHRGR